MAERTSGPREIHSEFHSKVTALSTANPQRTSQPEKALLPDSEIQSPCKRVAESRPRDFPQELFSIDALFVLSEEWDQVSFFGKKDPVPEPVAAQFPLRAFEAKFAPDGDRGYAQKFSRFRHAK